MTDALLGVVEHTNRITGSIDHGSILVSGESPRVPLWITWGVVDNPARCLPGCYKGAVAYDGVLTGFLLLDPFEEVPVSELDFDSPPLLPLSLDVAAGVSFVSLSLPAPLVPALAEEVERESVR
jgi:hypothetical protein